MFLLLLCIFCFLLHLVVSIIGCLCPCLCLYLHLCLRLRLRLCVRFGQLSIGYPAITVGRPLSQPLFSRHDCRPLSFLSTIIPIFGWLFVWSSFLFGSSATLPIVVDHPLFSVSISIAIWQAVPSFNNDATISCQQCLSLFDEA